MDVQEIVITALENEQAGTVLEISGFDEQYGLLMKERFGIAADRVDLSGSGETAGSDVYRSVFGFEVLSGISKLERYDVVLVFHLFENTEAGAAKGVLQALLEKTIKQVLVITPEYPYDLDSDDENKLSNVRAYHPVFFLGMDFSYKMTDTPEGKMQAYSFFPKIEYPPLPCDDLPDVSNPAAGRRLNIAYIIAHHEVTGGMKAVFAHMKLLSGRGHRITAYFRSNTAKSAVPGWCGISDTDTQTLRQRVIPEDTSYLDAVDDDEDVIILTLLQQAKELGGAKMRVALWEQGTPALFGDHSGLICSGSWQRTLMHERYRMPMYLLGVSRTVQAVLKGIYNREVQLFPPGIDTEFYHPAGEKNNEIPTVLLAGNPMYELKGFKYIFKVLETARQIGLDFKVQIAAVRDFALTPEPVFEYEKYIDPPQDTLAELYRNADIFISSSLYESFSLPPLEAMASETAVIAMDCGGITEYAEPGVNCLLCEQGDVYSMLYAFQYLLEDANARMRLAAAGRETALRYDFAEIMPVLEKCLHRIADS